MRLIAMVIGMIVQAVVIEMAHVVVEFVSTAAAAVRHSPSRMASVARCTAIRVERDQVNLVDAVLASIVRVQFVQVVTVVLMIVLMMMMVMVVMVKRGG